MSREIMFWEYALHAIIHMVEVKGLPLVGYVVHRRNGIGVWHLENFSVVVSSPKTHMFRGTKSPCVGSCRPSGPKRGVSQILIIMLGV